MSVLLLRFTPPDAFIPFAEAATQEPPLRLQTFARLRDFIYQLSGLFVADTHRYFLKVRLLRRMQLLGLRSFEEYLDYITGATPQTVQEHQELLNSIVVVETHFFRTPEHFAALGRQILPELASKRGRLRLWSAGCATGEEAYSMAMVVHRDFHPVFPHIPVEILGTDLSSEAIARAQRGRYRAPSLHGMPEVYKGYLREVWGEYEVVPEIRSVVRFQLLNLVDEDSVRAVGPVDVLFCRNVLLYLAPEVRRRVVEALCEQLLPGGYLFVGAAETLSHMTDRLQLVHFPRALAYWKPE